MKRISNELAIKLKELGMNEPCDMMYHKGQLTGTKMGMANRPNEYADFYAAYYLEEVRYWLMTKNIYMESFITWSLSYNFTIYRGLDLITSTNDGEFIDMLEEAIHLALDLL